MTTANDPQIQLICTTEPDCLCVPEESRGRGPEQNPWDECDCFQDDQRSLFKTCAGCGAQLVEIDDNTGEKIAA